MQIQSFSNKTYEVLVKKEYGSVNSSLNNSNDYKLIESYVTVFQTCWQRTVLGDCIVSEELVIRAAETDEIGLCQGQENQTLT